ncbi:hypothetical protein [Bradyrhizobium genosp. P]|uniref:hypothetical protein n=1 Tax=Bradyrhizobium genosp. P TaxID=83641 RepID=UPI003CF294BB
MLSHSGSVTLEDYAMTNIRSLGIPPHQPNNVETIARVSGYQLAIARGQNGVRKDEARRDGRALSPFRDGTTSAEVASDNHEVRLAQRAAI